MSIALLNKYFSDADVETEHDERDEQTIIEFVEAHPGLSEQHDYLDLIAFGGVHIASARFSMGIYGFDGDLVPSFSEQNISEDGFFRFADVIFDEEEVCEHIWVFAFDVNNKKSPIYITETDGSEYHRIANNFEELFKHINDKRFDWLAFL